MKLRIAWLVISCLALAAAPAWARYDNGPINGTTDAWAINFGYIVSDSFIAEPYNYFYGFTFGVWELPGDVMTSVDWSVTSAPLAGWGQVPPNARGGSLTTYGSGTASGWHLTDTFISTNQYGYDIDLITVQPLSVGLTLGTRYWLNLQNAVVPS